MGKSKIQIIDGIWITEGIIKRKRCLEVGKGNSCKITRVDHWWSDHCCVATQWALDDPETNET